VPLSHTPLGGLEAGAEGLSADALGGAGARLEAPPRSRSWGRGRRRRGRSLEAIRVRVRQRGDNLGKGLGCVRIVSWLS